MAGHKGQEELHTHSIQARLRIPPGHLSLTLPMLDSPSLLPALVSIGRHPQHPR
ncbi:hypothetical protein ASPBRDRAFT_41562 [Aspergillus brasiliensis CBS 101740]|uniref:Uncharacterized protein n=1 Tax=Aspergillus brasiliensis (strain CBS 101740 / IMI 381727 / IBT 21946) TaxID=767769 RepID=A0A1L9UQ36_ASPBC|nr:hypothetical protein ASPBRDRAFT_41562 [Aspergillus brasiliensis CBS 101740]